MTSIPLAKEETKLKSKLIVQTIEDLKKMLNNKETRTFYTQYMQHSHRTEITQICEAADLIRDYEKEIAVLRKFE